MSDERKKAQEELRQRPASREDEFFAKQEKTRLEEVKKKEEATKLEEEKEKLRKLHYMRCPKCGMPLEEIKFRDVAIDRCTGCSGVWLDKGELERLAGKEEGFLSSAVKNLFGVR